MQSCSLIKKNWSLCSLCSYSLSLSLKVEVQVINLRSLVSLSKYPQIHRWDMLIKGFLMKELQRCHRYKHRWNYQQIMFALSDSVFFNWRFEDLIRKPNDDGIESAWLLRNLSIPFQFFKTADSFERFKKRVNQVIVSSNGAMHQVNSLRIQMHSLAEFKEYSTEISASQWSLLL